MMDTPFRLAQFALVVVLLLLPGFYLTIKPAARFVGLPDISDVPRKPDQADPVAFRLGIREPLGLLMLDRSSSMNTTDPKFMQTLAAEAFAYFYAHLMYEDVAVGGEEGAHFAILLYSGIGSGNFTILDWNENSKFLRLMPTGRKEDIPTAIEVINKRLVDTMGYPGNDKRGGGTPIWEAAQAGAGLVRNYRAAFPSNDRVFSVFMTDGTDENLKRGKEMLERNFGGLSCVTVTLTQEAGAMRMLPEFLAGLEMTEVTATSAFKGTGYKTRRDERVLPIVISGSDSRPVIETSEGDELDVRGRDGLYYALFDPRAIRGEEEVSLRMTSGNGEVSVFEKAGWTLVVDPHYVDFLSPPPNSAEVRLEYTGQLNMPINQTQQLDLLDESGQIVSQVSVTATSSTQYLGKLPPASFFDQLSGEDFAVQWTLDGKKISYPFRVNKSVVVRFFEKKTGTTSPIVDWLPFYPTSQ